MEKNDHESKSLSTSLPMFSIKPAGNSSANLNDWLDLNDIFIDDFFPPGLDFESFFEENQNLSRRFSTTDNIENLVNISTVSGNNPKYKVQSSSKNSSKPILIPPSMPRSITTFTSVNSNTFDVLKAKLVIKEEDTEVGSVEEEEILDGNKKNTKKNNNLAHKKQKNRSLGTAAIVKQEEDLIDSTFDTNEQDMTDGQRVERRERNREHAKRSRIRKRVLLETLQDQLIGLRDQNIKLRRVVTEKIPKFASQILAECTTEESTLLANMNTDTEEEDDISAEGKKQRNIFKASRLTSNIASEILKSHQPCATSSSSVSTTNPKQGAKILMEADYRLIHSLINSQQNFVLSDPSLPDNPIVYASDGFCRLSGYKRQDILGHNCRFLQGPGTDQAAVDVIRKGVAQGRDISVCLLNYRADGSPFWNQFFLGALKDTDGQVVNYVGVQCEVNTIPVMEIKDRVKKLPMPDEI